MQQQTQLNPEQLRTDFPTLQRDVNGNPLAYLDNAATSQTPQQVIDAIQEYYEQHNANVHRCVHALGQEATELYDQAHQDVADFINAESWREVVFTKNATEALNMVVQAYAAEHLSADDEILITEMEHHSNLVPWQRVAEQTGATLTYAAITEDGRLDMEDFRATISDDTASVSAVHVSNTLGTVNPVEAMVDLAHDHDAIFVLDGAQSVPHMPVDVQDLDCDFLAFSGHKMCGPTGIGVLYGKQHLLEEMEPFLYGGGMISRVEKHSAEWNKLPWKHEAGTPNVAGAVGLSAAIGYVTDIGMKQIQEHSTDLATYMYEQLHTIDGVTVYGPNDRIGLTGFTISGAHPHDVSTLLNEQGIAVRGGHHCTQPLSTVLGVDATSRASVYLYNTRDEVDRLADAVRETVDLFN